MTAKTLAEKRSLRRLRQAGMVLWICVLPLFSVNVYGTTGIREPTIRNGAPGICDTLKLAPSWGNGTKETGSFAAVSASRNVCASSPASGGRTIPNKIRLAGLSEPGATFQFDRWRICEICIAKKSASGSPSIQRKFTDPGLADNILSISAFWVAEIVRHATTAFNFSVSSRAFAASLSSSAARTNAFPAAFPASIPSRLASATLPSTVSLYLSNAAWESAASCLVSRIMTNCATPTEIAATDTNAKHHSITLFQPSSDNPAIRLTPLEKFLFSVIAVSCAGLLVIMGLAARNIWRDFKSPLRKMPRCPFHSSRHG